MALAKAPTVLHFVDLYRSAFVITDHDLISSPFATLWDLSCFRLHSIKGWRTSLCHSSKIRAGTSM